MLRTSEEHLIYTTFGRNRPIETIDGYDETVHRGPFRICRISRIADGRSRCTLMKCVIKCLKLSPLDRDQTAEMRSASSYHSRYNASIKERAFDGDPVVRASTQSTRLDRASPDSTSPLLPRVLYFK